MPRNLRIALMTASLIWFHAANASNQEAIVLVGVLCDLSELTGVEQRTDSAAIRVHPSFRVPGDQFELPHHHVRLYLPEDVHVTWYNVYHGNAAEVHCVYLGTAAGSVTPSCGVTSVRLADTTGASRPDFSCRDSPANE